MNGLGVDLVIGQEARETFQSVEQHVLGIGFAWFKSTRISTGKFSLTKGAFDQDCPNEQGDIGCLGW